MFSGVAIWNKSNRRVWYGIKGGTVYTRKEDECRWHPITTPYTVFTD